MIRYALLFLLCTGFLFSEEAPLTLEACYRIALDQNPLKRAAAEGVVMAHENVGMARAPYYPDIGVNASYTRFRQFFFFPNSRVISTLGIVPIIGPENAWNLDVQGHYLLYDFGKRRAQLDQALAMQGIAREEEARIRQEILLNVALAFHSLVASEALHLVAQDTLKRTQEHLGIAQSRADVGDSPAVDVFRSQVKVAEAERELVRSRNLMRVAAGNLNTSMGLPPQLDISVVPELKSAAAPELDQICEALERSMCYRPEVREALEQMNVSRSQIQEAKSAFGPRLHARGLYGRLQNTFFPKEPEWSVALELEMSLFRGFEDVHNVRRARHGLSQTCAEYEQVLLDVRQDVWNAHSSLQEAYELIKTTEAQVKDALESVRLVVERYKVGSGTINDMLDSQTSLSKAEADHVSSLWQYSSAETRYLWAQGILKP